MLRPEVILMTRVRIFASDDRRELEAQINEWLRDHRRTNVRFLQLVANGETAYAVLVAWDEE